MQGRRRDCSIQGASGAGESAALKGAGEIAASMVQLVVPSGAGESAALKGVVMGAAMSVGNSTSAVGALAEGAAEEAVHKSSQQQHEQQLI